jgi:hypothetical protein
MEPGVTQGPLINADAVAKVEEHIADALAKGATSSPAASATPAAAISSSRRAGQRAADALIFREETFGPVAPLFRFKTEEEAIRWPTTPSSAWPPISTRATSAASSAWPRRWNTASSASTRASSPPRSRPSAA